MRRLRKGKRRKGSEWWSERIKWWLRERIVLGRKETKKRTNEKGGFKLAENLREDKKVF